MADPKLVKSSVVIAYKANDGYGMSSEIRSGRGVRHPETGEATLPEISLLEGIEELARLCSLFGFEAEARNRVEGAFERVRPAQQLRNHDEPVRQSHC